MGVPTAIKTTKVSSVLPQVLCVLVCTCNAISDGMQYGWSAPILPVLRKPDSPIKITESDEWWIEQLYIIGGLCGLPVTMSLVDRIGRKGTLRVAAICSLIGWILNIVSTSTGDIIYLLICRFLIGLASDVAFVASPMYIAEIADKKIRGILASFVSLMLLIGILVIYILGSLVPIYVSASIGCGILLFQLTTFIFIPESPYYFLATDRYDEAKTSLKMLRGTQNVDQELKEISAAIERQRSEKGRPQDLLLIKSNRKSVIIMTVLNASQHFSGISVVLMNLHSILEAGNSRYLQPLETGIIFAAVMFVASTTCTILVDKFGRKILLCTSSVMSGISLLVLGIYFSLKRSGYDVSGISWIPIVSVMIYAWSFRSGLGMIPIILTAELFPSKVKAMGMTLSDFMYLAFAFITIEIYHGLGERYGMEVPFYIFAASSLFTTLFTIFYIPETKGKTLEEIQFILKGETYPADSRPNVLNEIN